MKMQKILLIFTRDFDQWVQEMCRNSLVKDCRRIWGRGLSDQIVRFTGRTFEWYRYETDMMKLCDFLVHKKLNDYIFSKVTQQKFLSLVSRLRDLIKIPPSRIKDGVEHLKIITDLFRAMYPYYPLGIFIPGPWREAFLQKHGKKGEVVMKLLLHSREKSEGLLKEVGNYLREWLGPLMIAQGFPRDYVRLLTVREVEDLIRIGRVPNKAVLVKRSKGYVYFNDKIVLEPNFKTFLKRHELEVANQSPAPSIEEIVGTVAYPGTILRGEVRVVMNSYEISKFRKGLILVTPMTSPEYLSAMKQAKVIITDEGGVTCHAAIVARELRKPCVIGTKIATQVFKDGNRVEVDAAKGTVRKI